MRALALAAVVCASSVAHADLRERAAEKLEKLGVQRDELRDRAAIAMEAAGIEREVLERLARSMVHRARRAVAIGPHAGVFQQIDASDSVTGFGASFGLGLYVFDMSLRTDLAGAVKQAVRDELLALVQTGTSPVSVREVVDRVVDRMIDGGFAARPVLPPPRFSAILEGQLTFGDADGFGARLALGWGIWKLSVGGALSVQHINGSTTALLGPELSFRITPIGQTRTPVIDLFGRVEVGFRDEVPVTGSLGLRVLFDVL